MAVLPSRGVLSTSDEAYGIGQNANTHQLVSIRMIDQLSFIAQDVTVPLYALLVFVLLPGGYLAEKAKELVERYSKQTNKDES